MSSVDRVNPFKEKCLKELEVEGKKFGYYSFNALNDERVAGLPYSIRILLESAIRNADGFGITEADVEKILNWQVTSTQQVEIPYKPARVILQDFTGVPSVVDLAAMREAVKRLGGDPLKVNPLVPAELVIDHSVQVDVTRSADAVEKNLEIEMHRNKERFQFLKWGQKSFKNFRVVPPGSGIVHQVNLEYLARVVFKNEENVVYPDSCVGTDSHTTMINGLGVAGWGVGGLEAEAVMMGTAISMVLPEVVGYELTGSLQSHVTATDMVLTIVENLRNFPGGVVGKFVEFHGEGLKSLTLADRATIANMSPEYGATMGFFPVDNATIDYMKTTARDPIQCAYTEAYLREQGMFIDHTKPATPIKYTADLVLDIGTVVACVAGPKRPQDRVSISDMQKDWVANLTAPVSFKGFGLDAEQMKSKVPLKYEGKDYELTHGCVTIAAITSCTNTSNPAVLIAAGLVAKNAVAKGLSIAPYIKTSLAPGSHVVTEYLKKSELLPFLEQVGFGVVGYGCTTCIGNSGAMMPGVEEAIMEGDLVASAVLSGNRNFEGRVHALARAAWLASPPLVVAYALAGTTNFNFDTDSLGKDKDGKDVLLADIWPTNEEIAKIIQTSVLREMFQSVYASIEKGTDAWNALSVEKSELYPWDEKSTYIHHPPFFQTMQVEPEPAQDIKGAYCLLNLGDSITTDHISPAGNIAKNSPAARFLEGAGVEKKDFNTYGSRRGNDLIMARGTFANIRLVNKLVSKAGPNTLHVPSNEEMAVYDAAAKYQADGKQTIILGGAMYGNGSSRDWAAKGPWMQGVKAVIAKSFERIHRSNLVGMGIMPLVFKEGQDAETIGLTGKETFDICLTGKAMAVGDSFKVTTGCGKSFDVDCRLDTNVELEYYRNGGILHTVIRKLL